MAKRTDSNHAAIIKQYRELGFSVHSTHTVAGGFPDIVVGLKGITDLVEIKDGEKIPSKRKLTPLEQEFIDGWKGRKVRVVMNPDQVISHWRDILCK